MENQELTTHVYSKEYILNLIKWLRYFPMPNNLLNLKIKLDGKIATEQDLMNLFNNTFKPTSTNLPIGTSYSILKDTKN